MSKRVGLLTAVIVLAFPALAGARIVPNKSIAGINLGESKAAVVKRLGPPAKIIPGSPVIWVYKSTLEVWFKNAHVVTVFTENPAQKTASGIGPGSKESAVKARIKGVKCQHAKGFPGQGCITISRHGATDWVTDFHIGTNGRVKSVLVTILPVSGALDRALRVRS